MKWESLTCSSKGIFTCSSFRVILSFLPSQPLIRLQLCTGMGWLFVGRPWLSLCAPLQGGRWFSHTLAHCPVAASGHSSSSPGEQGHALLPAKLLWQGWGLRLSQGFMGQELSQGHLEALTAPVDLLLNIYMLTFST